MKSRTWIAPAAAIVAAACLLIPQTRALSTLRQRTSVLRQQVALHEKNTLSDAPTAKSSPTRIQSSGTTSINWLRIAELTGEQSGNGILARQELLRFKARVAAMTPDELLARLAETKTLGLDLRSYGEIDGLLVTALMGKDLQAAADYLIIPKNNHIGLPGDLLEKTINTWMKHDFSAALAWFDGKVADGSMASKSLSGKNHIRLNIEGQLLAQLYLSDPAKVTSRLKGYPENQRFDLFKQIFGYDKQPDRAFDDTNMASQVALAREILPAKEQSAIVMKSIAPLLKSGDYGKLEEFLTLPTTTPEDRSVTVRNAAGPILSQLFREDKLTLDEINKFHEWATKHSDGKNVDTIIGGSLTGLLKEKGDGGSDPTAKVNQLLLDYHEASGSDEVLLAFLGTWQFWGDADKARALAGKIHDPASRDQFLKGMESDPFAK